MPLKSGKEVRSEIIILNLSENKNLRVSRQLLLKMRLNNVEWCEKWMLTMRENL